MHLPSEDSREANAHLQLGTSYLSQGDFPGALKELLVAEQLDPDNPVIQNNLGLAYFVRERFELAEKHISEAVRLKPDYTDALNNLVSVHIEQNKLDLAEKEVQKVVADLTYPNPEKAYLNLGTVQFKKKQFSAAQASFQKSLDYQSDNCPAASYYGRSLFEQKRFAKASDALDRAVATCQRQQFDEPVYYSALTYYQLGETKKSEARFEELIKLYPRGKYLSQSREMLETIRK